MTDAKLAALYKKLRLGRYSYLNPRLANSKNPYLELAPFEANPRYFRSFEELTESKEQIPIAVMRSYLKDGYELYTYHYITPTWEQLRYLMENLGDTERHFQAIVLDKRPTHIYFDLDGKFELGEGQHMPDATNVMKEWETYFVAFFTAQFNRAPDMTGIKWETACTDSKFSLHCHVTTEAFVDVHHQKNFILEFEQYLIVNDTKLQYLRCVHKKLLKGVPVIGRQDLIDYSVYTKRRNFRLAYSCKPKGKCLQPLFNPLINIDSEDYSGEYSLSSTVSGAVEPALVFAGMPSYCIQVDDDYEMLKFDRRAVVEKAKRKRKAEANREGVNQNHKLTRTEAVHCHPYDPEINRGCVIHMLESLKDRRLSEPHFSTIIKALKHFNAPYDVAQAWIRSQRNPSHRKEVELEEIWQSGPESPQAETAQSLLELYCSGDFSVQPAEGKLIPLTRLRPSYCRICEREHEQQNQYALVQLNPRGTEVSVFCYQDQSNPKRSLHIGTLGRAARLVEQESEEPATIDTIRDMLRADMGDKLFEKWAKQKLLYRDADEYDACRHAIGCAAFLERHFAGELVVTNAEEKGDGYLYNRMTCLWVYKNASELHSIFTDILEPLLTRCIDRANQDLGKSSYLKEVNKKSVNFGDPMLDEKVKILEKTLVDLRQCKSDEGISKRIAGHLWNKDFMADLNNKYPYLISTLDGTVLDIRDLTTRPRTKDDKFTEEAPVKYLGNELDHPCEEAKTYYKGMANDDPDLEEFLQRIQGYMLTAYNCEKYLLFLYGPPGTGKSSMIYILNEMMGKVLFQTIQRAVLAEAGKDAKAKASEHTAHLVPMVRARLVVTNEWDEDDKLSGPVVKPLVSGGKDSIYIRAMYKGGYNAHLNCKILIISNFPCKFANPGDTATVERVIVLPVLRKFQKTPEAEAMLDELAGKHLSQMFTHLARGAHKWYNTKYVEKKHGLQPPAACIRALNVTKTKQCSVMGFTETRCEKLGSEDKEYKTAFETPTRVFEAYTAWAREQTEYMTKEIITDAATFGKKLTGMWGPTQSRKKMIPCKTCCDGEGNQIDTANCIDCKRTGQKETTEKVYFGVQLLEEDAMEQDQ